MSEFRRLISIESDEDPRQGEGVVMLAWAIVLAVVAIGLFLLAISVHSGANP